MSVRMEISSSAAPTVPPSREPASPSTAPGTDADGAGPREGCPFCPPATASPSEATLISCALAGWGTVLVLVDLNLDRAEALVFDVLSTHDHDTVLRWRTRCDPAERRTRWRLAVGATRRLYGDHFDTTNLPDDLGHAQRDLLPCQQPAALVPALAAS
jgi:hypothetical protein